MHLLEIIGFNIEACLKAQHAGASRIELCANPAGGGTTPSYALIKAAADLLKIPFFVMIRPREGDFLYSDAEFRLMMTDIQQCKELGCEGIVTGILKKDGRVDTDRMAVITKEAEMAVTFHRAFDRVRNRFEALEDLIKLGCRRVLTSGGKVTAHAGLQEIRSLVEQARNRIIVMPGSGIRASNITEIASVSGAKEFHSSAMFKNRGEMIFSSASMDEDLSYADVDEKEISLMLNKLREIV